MAVNTVVIPSKNVDKGQTGVAIPILLTNDVSLKSIILPIVFRAQTPGAFITSVGLSFGDRLPAVGGPLADIQFRNQYADEDGVCKDGLPGGFGTITSATGGPNPVGASPEGVLFVRQKLFVGDLLPGNDATGSCILTVNVTNVDGTFEVDTTCANPSNHLLFIGSANNDPYIPAFTKGIITIGTGGSQNHPPVAACQNVNVNADAGCQAAVAAAQVNNGSSDPDGDPITLALQPPGPFALGSTPIILIVTDDSGDADTCNATVTVIDNVPPSITCPPDIAVQCEANVPPPNIGSVTASDNCSVTVTHAGDVSDGQSCPETIVRTYLATDGSGNSASCGQIITVNDTEAPVITVCPDPLTEQCAADIPAPNINLVSATDNCGAVTITHEGDGPLDGGTCGGTMTRTYRATDNCGHFAECTQIFTVNDTEPPQLVTCAGDLSLQCLSEVPPCDALADAAFTDNCGILSVECVRNDNGGAGTIADPLIITDTYTATDDCANTAECARTITVIDDTPPVPLCPANIVELIAPGATETAVTWTPAFTDNCAGGTVVCDPPSGSTFPLGPTTVTCTATDAAGNTDECSFTVTVTAIFTNPPVAVDDHKSTHSGGTLYVVGAGVLVNDYDADGDPLTAVLNTGVSVGALTLNADGSFMYLPPVDYEGPVEFTYYANDGLVNSVSPATVYITVKLDPFVVADFNQDGFIDALDLGAEIDALFIGGTNPRSPSCNVTCADFDCSGFPDMLDLSKMIDHIFVGGSGPCDPCGQ